MHEYACFMCRKPTVAGLDVVELDPSLDSDTTRRYCSTECVRLAMDRAIAKEAARKQKLAEARAKRSAEIAKQKFDMAMSYVPKKKRGELKDRLFREHRVVLMSDEMSQ